jgi:hypothetical protein
MCDGATFHHIIGFLRDNFGSGDLAPALGGRAAMDYNRSTRQPWRPAKDIAPASFVASGPVQLKCRAIRHIP